MTAHLGTTRGVLGFIDDSSLPEGIDPEACFPPVARRLKLKAADFVLKHITLRGIFSLVGRGTLYTCMSSGSGGSSTSHKTPRVVLRGVVFLVVRQLCELLRHSAS